MTGRFVLRYRGSGARPAADVDRLAALPEVELVDETPRMLLVAGPEETLRDAVAAMPGWVMAPDAAVPLPDVRRRPRKRR
jgi:hypothetical protein